jgi:hypothetical protein
MKITEIILENFADGRHPEDKGDSKRHGIPKHATLAQLDSMTHAGGRKGQLAHWQANMRRGRAKNEAEGDAEGLPHLTKELLTHIVQQIGTEGAHAIIKSLEWGDGAADELLDLIKHDLEQDIGIEESVKQRLDKSCWAGYHKAGTKIKGGVRVNNCVANECECDDEEQNLNEQFDLIESWVESLAEAHGVDSELIWEDFESVDDEELLAETAAWRTSKGKNKNGGLNAKGVASYRRENPGSKLQTAVTTKPSKLKKGSKAAKRRKSFCARMSGVKGPMKKPNGKPTRKALALRKWNC